MQILSNDSSPFNRFAQSLERPDVIKWLQNALIGEDAKVPGPNGEHPLIYVDYVASGRALKPIEDFVINDVLPFYANSHTEASFCGQFMTRLRKQARQIILDSCNADERYAVIFSGSGATSGLNRLVNLLSLRFEGGGNHSPLIIIGPYEHHSNILPWRESGAEIIEIPESFKGGPDTLILEEVLRANQGRDIIGSFSAMSNVTGIVTDVKEVSRILKQYGALCIWDYAGAAPYLDMDMGAGTDAQIDAIVVSPHKFIGGPGASGVLILREEVFKSSRPTLTGGGTVSFVSPWAHDYSEDIVAREEAGTPNVIGDIRAALSFMVKDAIGSQYMSKRMQELHDRARSAWADVPRLRILGNPRAKRMPIFSFVIDDDDGNQVHQQLVTRMLSDFYGVQARGGCACAGPYAHRLLGINKEQSNTLRAKILEGQEIEKPGWTRIGFSCLMSDEKVDRVIEAVKAVASASKDVYENYSVDTETARFSSKVA